MRRLCVPLLAACLLLTITGSAQARYGVRPPEQSNAVLDTWLVSGRHDVGRSVIGSSPAPTLSISMTAGGTRVLAWRVSNVAHAPAIRMTTDCRGGGIGLRYFTPKGEGVTSAVNHHGYVETQVDPGTFRTVYVHVTAKHAGASRSCVLRGSSSYGGFDRVELKISS